MSQGQQSNQRRTLSQKKKKLVFWNVLVKLSLPFPTDLNITCEEKSVTVIWKLPNELGVQPSRLFLGKCLPTNFSSGPDGAVAMFHVSLTDCHFKRVVCFVVYLFIYLFIFSSTFILRPPHWHPHMPILSSGSAIGFGSLLFYMGIMNENFSGPARSTSFFLGSRIPIWAAVDQQAHMPLAVFIEECVATTTTDIRTASHVYPFITNGGCLVDGKAGSSKFLPRDTKSEIFLSLQAFKLGAGEKVYIHCKITAWDPELLDENRKACNYIKELEGWELLDDPTQSDLCRCCDTSCSSWKRNFRSLSQNAVLGPLTIEDVNLK
uniref:Zona pellucida glycoprotein 3f, tandem duplicate 2 n=1 Tax=Scleropages formosus TaxID=113540 RepID=A0A8C9RK80_SCLFO